MSPTAVHSTPLLTALFWCAASTILPAELVEIADRGTASQSTEWNGGQFPAALAIDGDQASFSHTDSTTPGNSWTLLLDAEYEVGLVELVMRADCCAGRLTGATLRLFDAEGDSVHDEIISDPGRGNTASFPIPPGLAVRTVRVSFENGATNPGTSNTSLHLGEVHVLAEIDLLPEIALFEASPASISSGGSSALSWRANNAVTVEITGIGLIANNGTLSVTPVASQIYTLIATNQHGSRSRSLAVLVDGVLLPPRLTEFMADNANTVVRSDGSTPDWIELWNPNPIDLDLAGYRLTDDPDDPARYVFPSLTLPAGSHLILDAALLTLDGVPATGFRLNQAADSYLAFANPAGQILQSFHYPQQREDVSYGPDWLGVPKFFLVPTPGAAASTGTLEGFVSDTVFSVDRGFFSAPFEVSITCDTPLAEIYTTTDGSAPAPGNPSATLYAAPLAVSSTTILRAAAFRDDYLPTDVDTQTYLFPAHISAQPSNPPNFPLAWVPNLNGVVRPVSAYSHFGLNPGVLASLPLRDRAGQRFDFADALLSLPSMSLVVDANALFHPVSGLHVNARERGRPWERPASIEFIDPNTGEAVHANCGLRMHGGWNRYPEMLKKTFRLYFRSEYGDDKFSFPLFPDGTTARFDRLILRSGNGKAWPSPWRALTGGGNSLERNTYLRDQFVRDLQSAMGNDHVAGRFVHLFINGHYWGLYNPVERPDEHFASSHFGGADEDYDVLKWIRGTGHQIAAGSDQSWNELVTLARSGPANSATYAAIAARLDLPQFVDYMLLNYFVGNSDWVDNNVYALRDRARNGPYKFYCWDSEEVFLSPGRDSTGQNVSDTCTELHHALRAHPDYRLLFADRAQKHLFNDGALTPPRTNAALMARAWEIDRAIVGDSARWGDLLRPSDPYNRADWLAEISNLRTNYLAPRVATTLNQLRANGLFPTLEAPVFLPQRGGAVGPDFVLSLDSASNPPGTIYYTTDGSDPRLPGGSVSPNASPPGSSGISFPGDTLVRTRFRSGGGTWSALDEALFLIGNRAADLVVSELMYHPAFPVPGNAEFLELHNRGTTAHELSDLRLTGGIQLDFSTTGLTTIAPGARIVLARDRNAFEGAYPGVVIAALYDDALGNAGDTFSLEQDDGTILWTLTYGDREPWPGGTDGDGHSLTYVGGDPYLPTSWRPSLQLGGSPGASDTIPYAGGDLLSYATLTISVALTPEGAAEFSITTRLGADEAAVTAQWSDDLQSWHSDNLTKIRQIPLGGGLARETWRLTTPPGPALFFRTEVSLR